MAQVGLLGLVEVGQQAPGCLNSGLVLRRDVRQAGFELLLRQRLRRPHAEPGLAAVFAQAVQPVLEKGDQTVGVPGPRGQHRFGGMEPAQLVLEVAQPLRPGGEGGGIHLPGGDVAQAQAVGRRVGVDGADVVVFAVLQHGGGDHRPRRHHPDDVPVHQAPGLGRVLGLLADGDFIALGNQSGDVAVGGVVGHPAHRGALIRRLVPVPGGQSQVQLLGYQLGILVEHLVKVPQPEEQNAVRVLGLDVQILLHHGGKLRHGGLPSFSLCAPPAAAHLQ